MNMWTLLIVLDVPGLLCLHLTTLSTMERTANSVTHASSDETREKTIMDDRNLAQVQTTVSQSELLQIRRNSLYDGNNAPIADKSTNSSTDRPGIRRTTEYFQMKNSTSGLMYEKSENTVTESFSAFSTVKTTSSDKNQLFKEEIIKELDSNDGKSSHDIKLDGDESILINISSTETSLTTKWCLDSSNSDRDGERNHAVLDMDTKQLEKNENICHNQSSHNSTINQTDFAENAAKKGNQVFGSIILAVVGFAVMMLNGLVVLTCRDQGLRKNDYLILVLGLSVVDFLLGLNTFLGGMRLTFGMLNSLEMCIIVTVMGSSCLVISLYQTFCISLHRYLVITNNKWRKSLFDKKRKYIVCLTGWLVLIGSFAFLVSPTSYDDDLCYHAVIYGGKIEETRWFYTIIMTSLMLATFSVYCFAMYSLKVRYLSMSADVLQSSNTPNKSVIFSRSRKRMVDSMKMVSILLLALYLFSGPLAVLNTLDLQHIENRELFFIAFSFAVLNSLINPIIYYFNIEEFQKALKSLFCKAPKDDIGKINKITTQF